MYRIGLPNFYQRADRFSGLLAPLEDVDERHGARHVHVQDRVVVEVVQVLDQRLTTTIITITITITISINISIMIMIIISSSITANLRTEILDSEGLTRA